jgi:hypothetical protein
VVDGQPFRHDLFPRIELRKTTTEVGRIYHTPDGNLPSVTTVLKYALDESGLDAWKARVGEKEAERQKNTAGTRGTAVHAVAERYLKNDVDWHKDVMPFNLGAFYSLKHMLDQAVGTIWGIEYPLWSKHLGTAGTADLLCEWWGDPAIVDFKTAKRFYGEDSDVVKKYLLQVATYATMTLERTGINIRKLVVLFSPTDELTGRAVVRNLEDYAPHVENLFCKKNRSKIEIPPELLSSD